jgi:beta-lactamase class A
MKSKALAVIGVFLAVSLMANVVLLQLWHNKTESSLTMFAQQNYPLLSRRIAISTFYNDIINNFVPLRKQLQDVVSGYNGDFAFYFEYLPTGTSIGIGEDDEFTAASLLKVPVVMAYYHKREVEQMTDDPEVIIREEQLSDKFGDLYKRGAGAKIRLSEAVKFALQQSDNTASFILADNISEDDFKFVYDGLDIEFVVWGDSPVITAQQYNSVLKSLYFSSILNKDDSHEILELLTKTRFKEMLPAPIPPDIKVAHKIGLIDEQIYQDCGIVYVPKRPYSLCMISKSDRPVAQERMRTVSKAVYDYVSGYKMQN